MNLRQLLKGDTFTFLVGTTEEAFQLHVSIVESLSEPFSRMINGHMKEGITRSAKLADIDPHVFGNFATFAYTGNYPDGGDEVFDIHDYMKSDFANVVEMMIKGGESQFRCQGCDESASLRWNTDFPFCGSECLTSKYAKRHSKCVRVSCMKAAQCVHAVLCYGDMLTYFSRDPAQRESAKMPESGNDLSTFPFGMPLTANLLLISVQQKDKTTKACATQALQHVKTAVFADKYNITALYKLAVAKTCWHLVLLRDVDQQIQAIIDLVEFVYDNTNDPSPDSGYSERHILRRMISEFVQSNIKELAKETSLQQLLRQGGEFGLDVFLAGDKLNAKSRDSKT